MPPINPPRPRNYDDMRFGEAFRMARQGVLKGGPKTFMWRGKVYTTELKEERQARVGRGRRGPATSGTEPISVDPMTDLGKRDFPMRALAIIEAMQQLPSIDTDFSPYGSPLSPGDETSMPRLREDTIGARGWNYEPATPRYRR